MGNREHPRDELGAQRRTLDPAAIHTVNEPRLQLLKETSPLAPSGKRDQRRLQQIVAAVDPEIDQKYFQHSQYKASFRDLN